jgi:hypothetical protein
MRCRRPLAGDGYFFFRRFVVFFAVFAFAFLFFAIAALLAMSGWRHRYSAVANRSALSSDYYSRRKITVTPLNFVCKRRVPRTSSPLRRRRRRCNAAKIFYAHICSIESRDDAKMPMNCRFLRHLTAEFRNSIGFTIAV